MKKIKPALRPLIGALLTICLLLCACSQTEAATIATEPTSQPTDISVPTVNWVRDVDFANLYGTSPDAIAWLYIPGTVIDYPVMRTDDNAFYLTHDIYGEEKLGGSLFTDMSNATDFSDPLTVIYGHYMGRKDPSLFSELNNFREPEFFDETRDVYVLLPGRQLTYEIVAAFDSDKQNLLYGKDYTDPDTRQEFVDWINDVRSLSANLRMDGVTADDQFLVLSTCPPEANPEVRYIVIARLVLEESGV